MVGFTIKDKVDSPTRRDTPKKSTALNVYYKKYGISEKSISLTNQKTKNNAGKQPGKF